jgi:hypothetical protein
VPLHSFVDESKRPSFLFVAALVTSEQVAKVRQEITALVLPGQRRIHFHGERSSRKAQILDRIAEMPVTAVVYESASKINEKAARDNCLRALARDQLRRDVRRLTIEREESRLDPDRLILRAELKAAGDRLVYQHLRAHEEALLALPDAIAWCWGRGGHWRDIAKGLVTDVYQA